VRVPADRISNSFRPGEIVDDAQIEELRRWQLLDFVAEPDDDYISDSLIVTVCGCGRSGTTLTRVMLDSHPALFAGPESLLFLPKPIDPADLAFKFDIARDEIEDMRRRATGRAQLIDAFQRRLMSASGKAIWVDKTARNVHRLDYILAHFPRAKVVHVVRDPRDVVASLKTHKKRKIKDGAVVPTGYCMPVDLCIDRWQLAIEHALAHRDCANYHQIQYESLVLHTERTLRALCQFLEVDFDDRMLQFHLSATPTRDYMKFPQNIEATKPLSTAAIGRYRTTLTEAEIAETERRLGDYMGMFGYRRSEGGKTLVSVPYQEDEACDFAVVSSRQVHEAIGGNPLQVKRWVQEAFRIHHDKKFLQPQKTYLLTSQNLYDRIIALPAAVLGDEPTLGIKWIGSHSQNHPRGLDRAHAVVVLNDPQTHATRVVMEGTLLSTWRTYAMSLIALDQFAPRPRSVGIIGMGKLGRMHAQTLGDLYPSIERIHCFSRRALHPDLLTDKRIRACEHVHDALDSEVIVTASAETAPYIHDRDLSADCRLIVNLSLMDCHADVFANSAHIVVDDLFQNLRAERVFKMAYEQGLLEQERVVELGAVLFGPRKGYHGRVLVNPLGLGLEDVYVAGKVARALKLYP
jgi:ornithine cyclodeaminase/alanine dehydrogenase-like protein (mu-crystallin family)